MRHRSHSFVLLLVTSCLSLSPSIALAESRDERTANRALTRGDELLHMGRHQEAIDTWRAGLRVMPHWILLLRIGNAFRQMNRCDPALTYLRLGYELRDDSFTDSMLPRLHQAIGECTHQMPPRLEVSSDQGQVTVSVDGDAVGTTPLDPFEVSEGTHSVEISREGYGNAETTVRTNSGTTTFVRLSLSQEAEDAQATPRVPQDSVTLARRRRALLWGGLLLGMGTLAAGGGAALIVLDGYELGGGDQGISSLGPGAALAALGGLLIGGGITLFFVHPPGRHEPTLQR